MTSREKTLAGAVAAAGLLWFASDGLSRYRTALDRNRSVQSEAQLELDEANLAMMRGRHARRKLRQWQQRSLPTNINVAESLYQDWLRDQLTGAGLEVSQLADKSGSGANPNYDEVAVEVTATGTLAQLTDFLHRFYTAVHLHRITRATLTAADAGKKLSVNLTIAALALPGSSRSDALAEGDPLELPAPLEELRTQLVSRNLFAPPAAKAGPKADNESAEAVVSWMTYGERGWTLGIRMTKTGKMHYFHEGDSIDIGQFKGKVVQIERRRAVVETEKGKMELRIEQKLSEATLLDTPAA